MTQHKILSVLWFVLGFGIFMFTRRSEIFPTIQVAIIIAPIFILRFIRTQPAKKGIMLTLLGFLLSMNIALWGLFEISDSAMMVIYNVIRSSLLAILYFLPYMLDRLIYPKFKDKAFVSSLSFPTIATAIFFLSSLEGPFDGTSAKTIFAYGPLILQQFNSVFGLWGFIFLFSWLAAVINYAWEAEFVWGKAKKIMLTFSSVVLVILLFGTIKISSQQPAKTVKVAAIVLIPQDGRATPMETIFNNKLTSPFDKRMERIESLTKQAAGNDAKIISFQEFAMTIAEKNEIKLIEQYKRIAREHDIYLSITYAFFSETEKGHNKHLLIDNQGDVKIDYSKRYLLGLGDFGETGVFNKGAEIIQAADTPYGTIAICTCRDMNFQSYIRQAGKMNADIMLSPSYDWPKSTSPGYYQRAIENGFSFVRPTYNGITFAEDFNGRILGRMDSDDTIDGIMYADVPTKGVKTIYATIGDIPGWLCVFGLSVYVIMSIKIRVFKD